MVFDQFSMVVLACGAVLVWYLTGLAYNRKLLGSYWVKIRDELSTLGASVKIERLQPNSVTIRTDMQDKQLRNVLIAVIVIGRQNPFSYVFSKLQKHRDTISIRANFQTPSVVEFELLNKHYSLTSSLLESAFRDWSKESLAETEFIYCWKQNRIDFSNMRLKTDFWRISVRTDNPNLLIALPADRKSVSPLNWFNDLIALQKLALRST
jgi:hypothetical protein